GRGGSGRRAFGRALHPLPFAPATHLCRKNPQCHAAEIRRPRGTNRRREAGQMTLATHNGLKEALAAQAELRPAAPCVMVIFGATGDLTSRKLIPALHNLLRSNLVSDRFAIIGIAREPYSDEAFRSMMSQRLKLFATGELDDAKIKWLVSRMHYLAGSFDDPTLFSRLGETLKAQDQDYRTGGNYFFYLATSPQFFSEITRRLGESALAQSPEGSWRRVVFEKPFGTDLESARSLNAEIKKVLEERQIYRIDHYLGKETVQNVLAFRFGNG